ncbi:tyrosine-type recombinase/integrase [Vibrio kyushuensis]|uniref:phage integrase n=1 Tax=Vibrio kyushuensis TaxID=2910249 RepID=UPI003D14AA1C
MSIRNLKDGTKKPWLCECYPQGRGGKRVRKRFATKGEATTYEKFLFKELDDKPWLGEKSDHRRLSELINLWFTLYGNSLVRGGEMLSRFSHIVDSLGNPLAVNLTAKDYSAYRAKRLSGEIKYKSGMNTIREKVGHATVNSELSRLKGVFNKLKEFGEWPHPNPLESVKPLKTGESEMGFLTSEQMEQLLIDVAANKNPDMLKIVRLCLSTGARWGEAEGLRGANLSKFKVTFVNTKTGKNRSVPITEALYEEIYKPTSGPLFKPCYRAFMRQIKQRAPIEVPKGQASHVLRHTFASHFMMNGGNILVLRDILGHADIKMTMRYAHFTPEHLTEALSKNPIATLKK